GTSLNYESKTSYAVNVVATDAALGASVSNSFTLAITDVNEAPSAVVFSNTTTSLAESASTASNVKLADIAVTDDALGTNTLSLSGADAASFTIVGSSLYLKSGTALNYENKTSYAVNVVATDAALGASVSNSFTLAITDVNEAPSAVVFSSTTTSLAESASTASNVKVADIAVTDDALGSETLSLTGADAASLGTSLNYESKTSYAVNVVATDAALGASVSNSFTLAITNTNEAPTVANLISDQNATEDSAFNFIFPSNTFTDVDAGTTLTYTATLSSGASLPSWLSFTAATRTFSGTPLEANVGSITVRVTASDGSLSVSDDFVLTVNNVNDLPTGSVSITGTATQGQTLTASNTLADADGLGTITYTWKNNLGTTLGTGSTYVLTAAEVGKTVTVTASYTDGHSTAESKTSAVTATVAGLSNSAPTGSVTFTAGPQVYTNSSTLTLADPGTVNSTQVVSSIGSILDVNVLVNLSHTYDSDLVLTLIHPDGTSIVLANGVGGGSDNFTNTLFDQGAATLITAGAAPFTGTFRPSGDLSLLNGKDLSGTWTLRIQDKFSTDTGTLNSWSLQLVSNSGLYPGQVLTAGNTLADANGLGAITYTWKDNTGATLGTGSTYTVAEAQVGKTITVTATYTDGAGNSESVTSSASTTVLNINDLPTGNVTISGNAAQGQTLTASNTLADADGLGTISYQWLANGQVIAGATGSTLLLGGAEAGKTISVRASYTDGYGVLESKTSSSTAMVTGSDATAPLITANTLTLTEANGVNQNGGAYVDITNLIFNAVDDASAAANLTFEIRNLTHGYFYNFAVGATVTSFTLATVNTGWDLSFYHDGSNEAPSFEVRVVDGGGKASAWQSMFINFTATAPVLAMPALTINEGQILAISSSVINATDKDGVADSSITFTVSNLSNGVFKKSGLTVTSFTLADINAGTVSFVHDGSNTAPTFSISVSDGVRSSATSAASITFNVLNDAPVITASSFTISEGATLAITAGMIEAVDDEGTTAISFTVSNLAGGSFQKLSGSWANATSFTRADIAAGNVRFVQDGSSTTPVFDISANDGNSSSTPIAASITLTPVNDAPVIVTNGFNVTKGLTAILDGSMLSASDEDNSAAQLTYTVSNLTHGSFEKYNGSSWASSSSFTQADVNALKVRFVHDNSSTAPTYSISVSDGNLSTSVAAGTINFSATNTPPTLTLGSLVIEEREAQIVTTSLINATDDGASTTQLTYTVSNLTHANFQKLIGTWGNVSSFSKQDVLDGIIRIVHDGTNSAPTYSITANDGFVNAVTQNATISFTATNDSPVILTAKPLILDATTHKVTLSTSLLNASDVDSEHSAANLTYTWSGLDSNVVVQKSNVTVTSFTQADLAAGTITLYRAPGLNTGVATDTVIFTVTDPQGAKASAQVAVYDDAMLNGDKWGDMSLSYCFLTSVPSYYGAGAAERTGFLAFTEAQKTAARDALAYIASVTNLTFTENTGDTNGSASQLTFGSCTQSGGAYAFAYFPAWNDGANNTGGDFWFNSAEVNQSVALGTYVYKTFLHELGHALGLSHPYDDGATYVPDPAVDSGGGEWPGADRSNTVMSYNGHPSIWATYAQTYLIHDISTLQKNYGANAGTNSGNTTYTFSQFDAKIVSPWDAGGSDIFDFSAATYALSVDLRAGHFSDLYSGSGTNNLSIPYAVTIENCNGGSYDDIIVGNEVANTLNGNDGNDTLTAGGGADILNGGNGNDTFIVAASDFSSISGGANTDTLRYLGARLDFTEISTNAVTGLELIDLATDTSAQVLRLSAADILELAAGATGSSALRVTGTAADKVDLDLESSGYAKGSAYTVSSVTYDLWHSSIDTTADLLVQQGVLLV
ncbi:MAG: hypothetical protein RL095_3816, partial [Verrucomicrobiota bacterium]